jgi:uncharacterized protein YyaL (SSP411 family)
MLKYPMHSRALIVGGGLLLAGAAFAADQSPLADAPTAYVRAQAASAVHWHLWTDAVLAQAKQQAKPVYVFVGSPLSELTRATINQTFASEKTVAWVNESFFCIFVDADAQPEVAAYAQHFISSVKQLKGYPVHFWLTPDTLQPYDGANYLPPSEEWGKAGFLKSARSALDTWKMEPTRAHAQAEEAIAMMKPPALGPGELKPDALKARLDKAAAAWIATIDPKNGGFGTAPKLPEPELIRFLLRRDPAAQAAALNAARALVNGAAHDPVDGGFYRRCIDEEWKEPYFQKTLAEQARIALALFEAADVAKDDKLRAAGIGALDFVLKELRNTDGTFAAAIDGTLEDNTDPAKRPKFIKVGSASTGALSLLITAFQHAGEKRLAARAVQLTETLQATTARATPVDHLAAALAFRALKDDVVAGKRLAQANALYFDPASGAYLASPQNLPMGIAVRVPASGDTPSAEVLALLAGVDQTTADLIRRNLFAGIEYDDLPPGDVLLGLGANR